MCPACHVAHGHVESIGEVWVSPLMVSLIRSFHEDMSAELRINGQDVEGEIRVSNGLRQGCTMAPALFNLFFNLVVEAWGGQCMEEGITIMYKRMGDFPGS